MKLRELKQGDKFKYAHCPGGAPFVKGSQVPGSVDIFYAHSTLIGYIYMADGGDEVIKVGNINEE